MIVLRIFWTSIAVLFTLLLIGKFILTATVGEPVQVLPAAAGLLLLFYLLFMLEGKQVAGLLVKDLDSDAIERFVDRHPIASSNKILPIHRIFHEHFEKFVVGRQLFVISTVVAMAFLNKSVQLPAGTADVIAASIPIGASIAEWFVDFLNSGVFAFVTSTLIPSWFSQILPQFWADGRAISFMALPGARIVLWITMVLARIQLGEPGHVMLRILARFGIVGQRQLIPIGKQAYHEASLNFYGRGKKQHEICFTLGNPTTVQEKIIYVFKGGRTDYLHYKIQLSAPVLGDIKVKVDLPENIHGQVEAQDTSNAGLYTYQIKILLNKPLPREGVETDEVVLEIEYQTNAYTDDVGVLQTTEFSSPLPTEGAKVSIEAPSSNHLLLKQPKVHIVEEVDGRYFTVPDDHGVKNWEILTNHNKADIQFAHPTVATIYQIEFQTMKTS